MFDLGFTEMMLIGIVALIVIGPERLPAVARTTGKYFGRLKRFMKQSPGGATTCAGPPRL